MECRNRSKLAAYTRHRPLAPTMLSAKSRAWWLPAVAALAGSALLLWLSRPTGVETKPSPPSTTSRSERLAAGEPAARLASQPDLRRTEVEPEPVASLETRGSQREALSPSVAKFRGRVIDGESGEPIAGAQVSAAGRRFITGPSGNFGFGGPKESVSVNVVSPDHQKATFDLVALQTEDEPLRLALAPLHSLELILLNEMTGDPVQGAAVKPARLLSSALADEGRFLIQAPREKDLTIAMEHAAFVPLEWELIGWDPDLHGTRIEIPMTPAAFAFGRVTGPDGTPWARARVFVAVHGEPSVEAPKAVVPLPPGQLAREDHWGLRTDAEGFYRKRIAHGQQGLSLCASHIKVGRSGLARVPVLEAGQEVRIDMALGLSGTLAGSLSQHGGSPVQGTYSIRPLRGIGRPIRGQLDGNGEFQQAEILPGEFEVTLTAADFSSSVSQSVTVEAGLESRVDLVLDATEIPLRGRIVNDSGEGLPGLAVCWVDAESEVRRGQSSSDSQGYFQLVVRKDQPGFVFHETGRFGVMEPRYEGVDRFVQSPLALAESGETLVLRVDPTPPLRLRFTTAAAGDDVHGELPSFAWIQVWGAGGDRLRDQRIRYDPQEDEYILPAGADPESAPWTLIFAPMSGFAGTRISGVSPGTVHRQSPLIEISLEPAVSATLAFEGRREVIDHIGSSFKAWVATGPSEVLDDFLRSGSESSGTFRAPGFLVARGLTLQEIHPDPDGEDLIRGLAAGRHALVSENPEFAFDPQFVNLQDGSRVTVKIRRR